MPLASASFLKAATQGSKAPGLGQFACASAAVGAPSSITATRAQAVRIVPILIAPSRPPPSLDFYPWRAPGAACPRNANSPILIEGPPDSTDCDPLMVW